MYTPGPWRVEKFGCVRGGPVRAYTYGATDGQIAQATLPDGMDVDERDANARLIAATPELASLLRAAQVALANVPPLKPCLSGAHDPTEGGECAVCAWKGFVDRTMKSIGTLLRQVHVGGVQP